MNITKSSTNPLTINKMLRLLRNVEDITAKELASEINLSPSYISEIETGKKAPTLKVLNVYGEYFGISPANLLYIQEEGLNDSNAELIVRIFEKKAEAERKRDDSKHVKHAKTKRQSSALQPA